VTSIDSRAVRLTELYVMGELGEETDADAGVCVGGAVVGLEDNIEDGGGIRGIPRGVPDNKDLCGGRSSSFSRDGLADIRRCSAGKESTGKQPITLSEHFYTAPQTIAWYQWKNLLELSISSYNRSRWRNATFAI
jgi:hypothetical protein